MNKKTDEKTALIDVELLIYAHAAKAESMGTAFGIALDLLHWAIMGVVRDASAKKFYLVVSGRDNFRKVLYPDYKAGRPPKPPFYDELSKEIRETYPDQWMCHDQIEADDLLGIMATNGRVENPIICSIDKDMLSVPGWHYNWNKDDWPSLVTQEEADYNWLVQLLMGDSTDNIEGMKGIGEVKAKKLIADLNQADASNPTQGVPHQAKLIYEKEGFDLDSHYKCLYLVSIWRNPMPDELLENDLIREIVKTIPSLN